MIRRIDHIGIAVSSIAKSLRFWKDALGLQVSGTESVETEGVDIAFLPIGETRLELLEPVEEDSTVGRFIGKHGEGIHHLTLEVDNIDQTVSALGASGVKFLGDSPRSGASGTRVAFLHPRSCSGVLVELVEKSAGPAGESDIGPGSKVLAYLRDPQEKLWGILRKIEPTGILLEGIDLSSFDDWIAQVGSEEESVVGPSVMFLPMARVERLLLDRSSGSLPSMSQRFLKRVGKRVEEILG